MFRRTVPAALKGLHERVIAAAQADDGTWLAVTPTHLVLAPQGGVVERIAWHEVVSGGWDRGEQRLGARLRGGRELLHAFPDDAPELVQAFRERVGASYVITRDVPTRAGVVHVSIRKDLASREMFDDVVPGPGVDAASADVAPLVARTVADLREQVGLPL